ncbi:MAG: PAS domain S-box protein [Phycisphaerales bacterium]|nr:MAG: PAS domain S-box protein [Phycisphaerales bacterium]
MVEWSSPSDMTDGELRRAAARHEAILASAQDPIVTIDVRGMIHSVSKAMHRVLGYQPDELIGQNISMLMPDPHRSQHDSYLENYRRTGQTNILGRTREFHAMRKNGSLVPVEISVSRVDMPDGEEPLFIGIIHDISERKQTEKEFAVLQELTLAIADSADLDDALVALLEKICDLTGWDYGEAWLPDAADEKMHIGPCWHRGGEMLESFHLASRSLVFERGQGLIGGVLADGQPRWLTNLERTNLGSFVRIAEARAAGLKSCFAIPVLSAGETALVLAFFTSRPRERDDHLLNVVSIAASRLGAMIERRRAEHAKSESERKFREMLTKVQLIAVMLDQQGAVTFCNDYLLALTGYERDEVTGRNWFEMFLPEKEQSNVLKLFQDGLRRERIEPHYENHIRTRDGRQRLIAWSNSIMHDAQGKPVGATALGVDITDQRKAERVLRDRHEHMESLVQERTRELEQTHELMRHSERLISIGTLAAGLGHDMNNALMPMRCRIDAIDAKRDPQSIDEHLRTFRRSMEYLQQLTDALHLLALDPNDPDASTETTDPAAWWECVSPLLARAAKSHAHFDARLAENLPPVAVAPHRLTQAALNLIVNAGDAVDEHYGMIRLRITCPNDRRYVHITVSDNGCGMTDEVKRYALDPFFTTKTRGMGTGLGLPLVHSMTRAAGGTMKIVSTPGKGTSITIAIPIAATQADDATEQLPDRPTACVAVHDVRIASMIEMMLSSGGVNVRHISEATTADPCSLLVVDAGDVDLYCQSGSHNGVHRLVLGGIERTDEENLTTIIDDPTDFDLLRQGIGEAIDRLTSA